MPIAIAVAVLVRDGRALLGHRHPNRRWYPDCWDLIGGHVEPGETPEEAVRRECREEIGVEIEEFRPLPMAVSDPNLDLSAFLVTQWQGEPTNTAPDEHDDLAWFTADEIAHLTLADPAGRTMLQAATRSSTTLPVPQPPRSAFDDQ
ncbi:MAG: NUDIX domain-containing protein [Tetrasphaera jenkinsii]|jgi:8-oxo-dGTP diphosphatase|nr:NUDIX domain-containing protein [Tetrasphaera jenkinsii]